MKKFTLFIIFIICINTALANPATNLNCKALGENIFEPEKLTEKQLSNLKFKYIVKGFDFDREKKILKHITNTIKLKPSVGVKLKKGYLLGNTRGEWGGNLIYKNNKKEELLISDNIENIHTYKSGYIVTAGLAHLIFDKGAIYFVKKNKKKGFTTLKLYTLPSKPISSWTLKSKELVINLRNGNSYLLSDSGKLKQLSCLNLVSKIG